MVEDGVWMGNLQKLQYNSLYLKHLLDYLLLFYYFLVLNNNYVWNFKKYKIIYKLYKAILGKIHYGDIKITDPISKLYRYKVLKWKSSNEPGDWGVSNMELILKYPCQIWSMYSVSQEVQNKQFC